MGSRKALGGSVLVNRDHTPENELWQQLQLAALDTERPLPPVELWKGEYPFAKHAGINRNWRFDFAMPERMIAVEVEGGTRKPGGGRHNRADGYEKDCEKYNHAIALGWKVYRFTSNQVWNGAALKFLREQVFSSNEVNGTNDNESKNENSSGSEIGSAGSGKRKRSRTVSQAQQARGTDETSLAER